MVVSSLNASATATEIICNLLSGGTLHGQFDGEYGFALPAKYFTFKANEKLRAAPANPFSVVV